MNYGLYLSASGVLTNLYRQDVFANNLANVNTVGFKRDLAMLSQRPPEAVEDALGFDARHDLLDRLGGGLLAGPQRTDFSTGPLQQTDNPLDAALLDEDTFFTVAWKDPASGQVQTRYSRDGRFTRDAQGRLVTVAGGHPVLNADRQPIVLPDGVVRIDRTGQLLLDDAPVARLGIVRVAHRDALVKQGELLFEYTGRQPPALEPQPQVRGGFLEQSTVDPIKTLMQLISATKAVTSNGNLIRYHDQLMDRAVNTLGRVA